jgi:peptidoglycan/xylan/chitin deacetylase (PgdA/CDA1 family)
VKQAVLQLMRASGVFATCRRACRGKILILTYHRFSARPARGALPAAAFGEQLEYLRAHYTIVPLSAVERHLTEGHELPRAPVVITIDDGYDDAYEVAFPLLRRHRAPATLFAATDFVDHKGWLWPDKTRFIVSHTVDSRVSVEVAGRFVDAQLTGADSRLDAADRINAALKRLPDGDKEDALATIASRLRVQLPASAPAGCRPLTWNQAREMVAAGMEIGSHTVTHPILPRLPVDQVARELQQSRGRLEEVLGREVTSFCYPNGDYNTRVRDEAARAGYRVAVTTEAGLNDRSSDPLALRRIHTDHDLTHFIQSTSGFDALKQRLRNTRHSLRSAASAPHIGQSSAPTNTAA